MFKGADLTFCTYHDDGTSKEVFQEYETFQLLALAHPRFCLLPETKQFAIYTVGVLIMRHSKTNFFLQCNATVEIQTS